MSQQLDPLFLHGPRNAVVQLSAACADETDTANIVDLFTATGDANGSKVIRLYIKATDATSAGKIFIFVKLDGTNYRLIKEVPVTAVATVDAATSSFQVVEDFDGKGFGLQATGVMAVATSQAEAFDVTVLGGDFG